MRIIGRFEGKYFFLSNLYRSTTYLDGLAYPTTEHAYQAQKTENLAERARFSILPPMRIKDPTGNSAAKAKREGHKLRLRKGWDKKKMAIMLRLVLIKFLTHADLEKKLLATRNAKLEHGNDWGDRYWGTVGGQGENHLGQVLMGVRDILRTFVDLEHKGA